jgi:hypothetical protein
VPVDGCGQGVFVVAFLAGGGAAVELVAV